MKAAATMECTAAVKADRGSTAVKSTACEAARCRRASDKPTTPDVASSVVARTAVEPAAVIAMEPGTGTDEDAICEPIRSVVAVGSAGVRVIAVVTVGTDGGGSINGAVNRPNAEPHADAHLRLGSSGAKESQNSKQNSVFEVSHKF